MRISVCIPFRSGNDALREENFGFVWTEWLKFLGNSSGEVVVGQSTDTIFNRSAARNEAYSRSHGDILVFADADTLFVPKLVASAIGMVTHGLAEWVLPYTEYYNASDSWSRTYKANPVTPMLGSPPLDYEHCLPGATSGVLVTSRKAYKKVGGYDPRFIGWGWEDLAFSCALSSLCGKPTRIEGFVVHLHHERSFEVNFGQPFEAQNRALYNRYYQSEHEPDAMRSIIKEHSSCG